MLRVNIKSHPSKVAVLYTLLLPVLVTILVLQSSDSERLIGYCYNCFTSLATFLSHVQLLFHPTLLLLLRSGTAFYFCFNVCAFKHDQSLSEFTYDKHIIKKVLFISSGKIANILTRCSSPPQAKLWKFQC